MIYVGGQVRYWTLKTVVGSWKMSNAKTLHISKIVCGRESLS